MTGQRFDARLLDSPELEVQGTKTTHAHAIGATTLLVEMAGDFDDEPLQGVAYLRIRPASMPDVDPVPPFVVAYSTWDGEEDEQEFITLVSGLPFAVPAESLVDVWSPNADAPLDVTLGQPVTVYEAPVMPDDEDVSSQSLTVTVHPDLIDTLSGDVSVLSEGVPVLVETQESYSDGEDDGDQTLYLTRVLGGPLKRDGSSLDRNTVPIPDGVVVDPDAPPETPPLVEAFGGIGSILLRVQETTVATDKIDLWTSTTSPVDTSGDPDDTMLGVSRAAHVIRRVEGMRVVAGTTYYIVAKARNVKGSSGPSVELAVTPSEATTEDLAVDSLTADMLLANNIIAAAIDAADLYAVRITGARIRTAVAGARCEIFVDDNGRGRIRFFDDFDQTIGAIQAISEGGTQRFTVGAAGPNAPRNRWWVDQFGNRYADVISDTFNVFGLIQGTNGLTLQLSPTVLKGFDGNSGVTRVLSSEGTTTVPHQVAGGGTVHCLLRGGNGHLFHVHAGSVTGTDITFQFRYRSDNTLAVNETVTFDWSITAYQR